MKGEINKFIPDGIGSEASSAVEAELKISAPLGEAPGKDAGQDINTAEEVEPAFLFDLRELKEMLPAEARKRETNGSFYAGTLEREWVYRKLCELGFVTNEIKSRIEERQRGFQERGERFSFEQTFQELLADQRKYIELLSRALSFTEAGILSEDELREFEERLCSGGDGSPFLSERQNDAKVSFLKAFPSFVFYEPSHLERIVPLHIAFQQLFPRQTPLEQKIEERYLCTLLGSTILPRRGERKGHEVIERVQLFSHKEMTALDGKLASLNTIRRARLLGVITSQAHADALAENVRRN